MENESVACIISSGSRVLLGKRLPGGRMGGLWEFPGGKVEPGETHREAIARELMEEFGARASVGGLVAQSGFEHDGKSFRLYAYEVSLDADVGGLRLSEHSEVSWTELDLVPSLRLVDSDMKLYPAVRRHLLGKRNA